MWYKYRKWQIFGKKLNVPKMIEDKVYDCTLSISEFFKYELDDKIPLSCLKEEDRRIVEKFGIEKAKTLDFELLDREYSNGINLKEILIGLDASTQDLNRELYELLKDQIRPSDYTSKMKEIYKDRLIEILDNDNGLLKSIKQNFNNGEISLRDLIKNWDLFKDKDLSYCLKNKFNITFTKLKEFMDKYDFLAIPFCKASFNDIEVYQFINNINIYNSETEMQEYIRQEVEIILMRDIMHNISLDDSEYKKLFEYSSLEDYLEQYDYQHTIGIIQELKTLPKDYIFDSSIPFQIFKNRNVLAFINTYGLKNVIDFDNECGHFFTKKNYQMLMNMYDMFLSFDAATFKVRKDYDENGQYIGIKPYTKEEFYEVMRKMLMYGPTNEKYKNCDYRDITGEFKEKNPDLFIKEDAPKELQDLFYTKEITPELLKEHPEYIQYLDGKNIRTYINKLYSKTLEKYFGLNVFNIIQKTDFTYLINILSEYSEIFDFLSKSNYFYHIEISETASIKEIIENIKAIFIEEIIKNGKKGPKVIPHNLKEAYPSMFLSDDAPEELKEAFYEGTITSEFILSNRTYRKFLINIDLELLYKKMVLKITNRQYMDIDINFVNIVKKLFDKEEAFDMVVLYGQYYEKYIQEPQNAFYTKLINSKEECLNQIEKIAYYEITFRKMKYNENLPSSFKEKHKALFLSEDVPVEIKNKFYNKELTLEDFNKNPNLIDIFKNTILVYGFSEDLHWMTNLYNDEMDIKLFNLKCLKIIYRYNKINNKQAEKSFRNYILNKGINISDEDLNKLSEIIIRVSTTNSLEMTSFSNDIIDYVLASSEPYKTLGQIEIVFVSNNLPLYAKMFKIFQILYPNLDKTRDGGELNFSREDRVSPMLSNETIKDFMTRTGLKLSDAEKRFFIIYNDLLRTTVKSGSRDLKTYLKNISRGNDLFLVLSKNNFNLEDLSLEDKKILETFIAHLKAIYENTIKGKNSEVVIPSTLEEQIKFFNEVFKSTSRYDLKDRIVRSFGFWAGYKSFDSIMEDITKTITEANKRNEEFYEEHKDSPIKIEKGDLFRGIGDVDVCESSLNNGNFSKEHLSVYTNTSISDTTPLDVDFTYAESDSDSIYSAIEGTPTGFGFGNIYVVIRKDNKEVYITRDSNGKLTNTPYDPTKLEAFRTGYQTHFGIRTGFAFTDIDYIIYKKDRTKNPYDEKDLPRLKFEIARNGYYIPVVDFAGKFLFTPEEYKELRNKMSGLSYYEIDSYNFSNNLYSNDVYEIVKQLEENKRNIDNIKSLIYTNMNKVLSSLNMKMETEITGNLTKNVVEVLNTGSTARYTNIPESAYDFDFIVRIDRELLNDSERLENFRNAFIKEFNIVGSTEYPNIKHGNAHINGIEIPIDISFVQKTDKVGYSTEMCLQDRFDTIEKQKENEERINGYTRSEYVKANIILAKKVLKEGKVYGKINGFLGGVAIENWVLEYGGSFIDATNSFLNTARKYIDIPDGFEKFKFDYQIWDFGENHYRASFGFLHDNFIELIKGEENFRKMYEVLNNYINNLTKEEISGLKL